MSKVVPFSRRRDIEIAPGPLFEAAWKAFPAIGRERSSRRESMPEWAKASCDFGEARLLAAVGAFARDGKDQGYCPGFHRWLAKGRFEHWLDVTVIAETRIERRFADEPLRESFHLSFKNERARRWFDACGWEASTREIFDPGWAIRQEWMDKALTPWMAANAISAFRFKR